MHVLYWILKDFLGISGSCIHKRKYEESFLLESEMSHTFDEVQDGNRLDPFRILGLVLCKAHMWPKVAPWVSWCYANQTELTWLCKPYSRLVVAAPGIDKVPSWYICAWKHPGSMFLIAHSEYPKKCFGTWALMHTYWNMVHYIIIFQCIW